MIDSHALVGSCAQVGPARPPLGGGHARRRARAGGRPAGDRRGRGARRRQLRRLRGDDRGPAGRARRRGHPHRRRSRSTTSRARRTYRREPPSAPADSRGRGRGARLAAAPPARSPSATGSRLYTPVIVKYRDEKTDAVGRARGRAALAARTHVRPRRDAAHRNASGAFTATLWSGVVAVSSGDVHQGPLPPPRAVRLRRLDRGGRQAGRVPACAPAASAATQFCGGAGGRAGAGKRLGQALVEIGAVSDLDLEDLVAEQLHMIALSAFRWTAGTVRTEDVEEPIPADIALPLSTERLLLEGARTYPDPRRLEQALGDPCRRVQRAENARPAFNYRRVSESQGREGGARRSAGAEEDRRPAGRSPSPRPPWCARSTRCSSGPSRGVRPRDAGRGRCHRRVSPPARGAAADASAAPLGIRVRGAAPRSSAADVAERLRVASSSPHAGERRPVRAAVEGEAETSGAGPARAGRARRRRSSCSATRRERNPKARGCRRLLAMLRGPRRAGPVARAGAA